MGSNKLLCSNKALLKPGLGPFIAHNALQTCVFQSTRRVPRPLRVGSASVICGSGTMLKMISAGLSKISLRCVQCLMLGSSHVQFRFLKKVPSGIIGF